MFSAAVIHSPDPSLLSVVTLDMIYLKTSPGCDFFEKEIDCDLHKIGVVLLCHYAGFELATVFVSKTESV